MAIGDVAYIRQGLFDLNHDLNRSQKIIDLLFVLLPVFLIADLYESNTNNCLQASRSTVLCFLIKKHKVRTHMY